MTTHPREQEIVEMLRNGISCKETSRVLRVSHHAVYRIRDAYNIPNWFADPNGPACRHGHPWPENLAHYPSGKHYCRTCANLAKRRSYQPISADDVDEIAVELAVAGRKVPLRPSERRQAVRQLLQRNLTGTQMAARIGCTPRTIWRIRKQLRQAA